AFGQRSCDRLGQVLVPTGDVVALVGDAVDSEALRAGLVGEQVDDVERRLVGRVRAVLLVVGDVEQPAERGAVASGYARLDPVVGAHVVERVAGRLVLVPERWVAGRGQVVLRRGR